MKDKRLKKLKKIPQCLKIAVKMKPELCGIPQVIKRCQSHRVSARRTEYWEWNEPKRCMLQAEKLEEKSTKPFDMRHGAQGFFLLSFCLFWGASISLLCPKFFPFIMVMNILNHCIFKVFKLLFHFIRVYNKKIALSLRRAFKLWIFQ